MGAGLADWDEQATVCHLAESSRLGFESNLWPFAACPLLSLSFPLSLHCKPPPPPQKKVEGLQRISQKAETGKRKGMLTKDSLLSNLYCSEFGVQKLFAA